jgi:hypothetical protein
VACILLQVDLVGLLCSSGPLAHSLSHFTAGVSVSRGVYYASARILVPSFKFCMR